MFSLFKTKTPAVEATPERLEKWQIQSLQAELKVQLYKAYKKGFLPQSEYEVGERRVESMPVRELKQDITYYTSLLQSKEAA